MKGTHLGEFEELILLAVAALQDEAYGLAIKKEIEDQASRKVTLSAVHAAANRLEEKGYLSSGRSANRFRSQLVVFQFTIAVVLVAGSIMSSLTGLAIFVACLGLLALATFMAQQRCHEIGVRKVLGADTKDIVLLLTKRFVLLVMIAIALAIPLAWWLATDWLSEFAYRVELRWPVFAIAAGLALLLAILTMSYQVLRAAWTNPVETIRRGE